MHEAHMLQACGLGSSQVMSLCVLLCEAGRSKTVQHAAHMLQACGLGSSQITATVSHAFHLF